MASTRRQMRAGPAQPVPTANWSARRPFVVGQDAAEGRLVSACAFLMAAGHGPAACDSKQGARGCARTSSTRGERPARSSSGRRIFCSSFQAQQLGREHTQPPLAGAQMCLPLADSCQPRMDRARVDGSQPLGRIDSDDDGCSLAEIASLRRKSGPWNGLSLSCAQKRRAHRDAGDCCALESICRRSKHCCGGACLGLISCVISDRDIATFSICASIPCSIRPSHSRPHTRPAAQDRPQPCPTL